MIIDFHTHVFPDRIAEKTVEYLAVRGSVPAFGKGTEADLLEKLSRAGVDAGVVLPVLTNPKSFEGVNRYARELNEKYENAKTRLISFGAIHPACDGIEGKMKWLKENGFSGVKIHPDYQETYINDAGYEKILNAAREYDLIVLTHAGVDFAYPNDVHCPPSLAKELLKKAPHKKMVFAHLGGEKLQESFLNSFENDEVYFDTGYVLGHINAEIFGNWLKRFGDERILFASDSPWSEIARDKEILSSYVSDEKSKEKILGKNAEALLGIQVTYGI